MPGGLVDLEVEIKNESVSDEVLVKDLKETKIPDTIYGCTPSLPATLQPGESIPCRAKTFVDGKAGDVFTSRATTAGIDDDGYPVSDVQEVIIRIVQSPASDYNLYMPFVHTR